MYIFIYIHNILVIEFNRLLFSICGRWFRILLIVQLMPLCVDNIRDMCWIPIANVFVNQIFRLKNEFSLIWNFDIFLDHICFSSEFSYIYKYHLHLSYFLFSISPFHRFSSAVHFISVYLEQTANSISLHCSLDINTGVLETIFSGSHHHCHRDTEIRW